MGKHKHPAPRGYDPGGFRFPGRSSVELSPGVDYIRDARGIAPIVFGSRASDIAPMALAVVAAVAAIRRRRG